MLDGFKAVGLSGRLFTSGCDTKEINIFFSSNTGHTGFIDHEIPGPRGRMRSRRFFARFSDIHGMLLQKCELIYYLLKASIVYYTSWLYWTWQFCLQGINVMT